jgi:phosphocarrier protein
MIESTLTVRNRAGVHTRPAAMIVKVASRFKSDVYFYYDGFNVNAKSIIGVMTLAAAQGAQFGLTVEGPDEADAERAVQELFESGFGEP